MGCGAEVAHVAPPAPGKCGMEGKATYFLCFFWYIWWRCVRSVGWRVPPGGSSL